MNINKSVFGKHWLMLTIITIIFVVITSAAILIVKDPILKRFKSEISWATDITLAALNPTHIRSAAESLDLENFIESQDVKRLKEELESLGNLFLPRGVGAIYLLDRKGSEIYFLVESTPFGEIGYVVPGSLYREAPIDLHHVFSAKEASFTDVYTDEYGTYFSEFTPVFDRDGVIIAALGVDVDYSYFQKYLLKSRLLIFGVSFAIYLLLVLVILVLKRKQEADKCVVDSSLQTKAIIDSIPSSLIAFDSNQKIVFWNHACNAMFGLSSKEASGKKISDILKFKKSVEQISGKELKSFDFSRADSYVKRKVEFVLDRQSEEIVIESSFSFFEMDGEKMTVVLFDDISLKKKKDKELEEQKNKVEKMNALMLDREMKMVELKSEIARIKEVADK